MPREVWFSKSMENHDGGVILHDDALFGQMAATAAAIWLALISKRVRPCETNGIPTSAALEPIRLNDRF